MNHIINIGLIFYFINSIPPHYSLFIFLFRNRLFFKFFKHRDKTFINTSFGSARLKCSFLEWNAKNSLSFFGYLINFTASFPFKGGRNYVFIKIPSALNGFSINIRYPSNYIKTHKSSSLYLLKTPPRLSRSPPKMITSQGGIHPGSYFSIQNMTFIKIINRIKS